MKVKFEFQKPEECMFCPFCSNDMFCRALEETLRSDDVNQADVDNIFVCKESEDMFDKYLRPDCPLVEVTE